MHIEEVVEYGLQHDSAFMYSRHKVIASLDGTVYIVDREHDRWLTINDIGEPFHHMNLPDDGWFHVPNHAQMAVHDSRMQYLQEWLRIEEWKRRSELSYNRDYSRQVFQWILPNIFLLSLLHGSIRIDCSNVKDDMIPNIMLAIYQLPLINRAFIDNYQILELAHPFLHVTKQNPFSNSIRLNHDSWSKESSLRTFQELSFQEHVLRTEQQLLTHHIQGG